MDEFEELASSFLDIYPSTLAVLDREGTVVWANQAWERYGRENGLAPDETTVGQNYLDVVAAADLPSAAVAGERLAALMAGEQSTVSMEYPCHGPDRLRWFEMQALSVAFEGEEFYLVAHQDVTERTIAQNLTEARQAESAKLNEMLLHDVGNALTSAQGAVDYLERGPASPVVLERIRRAHTRIEESLDASRRVLHLARDRPEFRRVSATELARSAWKAVDPDDAMLTVEADFPVICYPRQAETLFESLFGNATAAVDGVTVTVSAGDREFTVTDDRPDPVPDPPESIFEATPVLEDGRYQFGLALVEPLVRLHGWDLSLTSAPDGGWQFTVQTEQLHVV